MKNIDEFDYSRELHYSALVIDNFNQLELLITKIITSYVNPETNRIGFFVAQIMNNSIISFGSKIKLLLSINKEGKYIKLNRNSLHRLLAIRNAIAHNDIISKHKVEIFQKNLNVDVIEYTYIEMLKADGSVESIRKDSAFLEFMKLHEKCIEELKVLHEKINHYNK